MLTDLTYTTRVINGFGHQQAFIRSPHSSRDFIWSASTSHAAGGKQKHGDLIHRIARQFIEDAADAPLIDNLARYFDDGRPAIFQWFDGGEDPSDEPTKIVCLDPKDWGLSGPIAHPWTVTYGGLVFHLDDPTPTPADYGYTPFWTAAWMEQITIDQLEHERPDIAEAIRERHPGREFSVGPADLPPGVQ